ncbi:MAG: polysaccharide biosynthesis C-terminal domain-containing protein, partial [Clostridia bacterium]|nr:polysaccharide biosynthesis C-terminal domain-containing protein [Clostridia bacterium]
YLIMTFSPLIVIIGLSNVLGLQYLIPLSKDNKFTLAICCGAVVNFVLNLFFIPKFYSYGAAVASLIAETAVTVTMFILARKDVSVKKLLKNVWKNMLAGVIMFVGVYVTQIYLTPSVLNSVLLIGEGILIYFVLLLILKDGFLFGFLQKLKEKISNKE